ncbi:hypothetical protein PTKIN_Ptkin12aG0095700 [Pterospermum kingtungense]
MSGVAKLKFEILNSIGDNYLTWCMHIQLHLKSEGLEDTLNMNKKDAPKANEEVTTMILIRQHLHQTFCYPKLNMIGNI